jgi:hypothetical protein
MFQNGVDQNICSCYDRIIPEQTFGVDIMIQSWVLSSNTSPAARVHTAASFKARFASSTQPAKGWRFARILFFATAFVILFTGMTLMRTFASEQRIEPASASEQVLSVDTGDTLWTLAASVKKDSMDIRDAVHQIMKRNGLTSSALSSGQDLVVPDTILP